MFKNIIFVKRILESIDNLIAIKNNTINTNFYKYFINNYWKSKVKLLKRINKSWDFWINTFWIGANFKISKNLLNIDL